jgi:hypothetical protein
MIGIPDPGQAETAWAAGALACPGCPGCPGCTPVTFLIKSQ